MAHYYLQIKSAHVFLGLLVAALFFLSFATVSFEDRADRLCCEVEAECQQYVLDELNAMVERAGINV